MAAIPQRLKTSAVDRQDRQRSANPRAGDVAEPTTAFEHEGADIPIFCAGCGEVIGFLKKGQSVPTYRCPACQAAESAKASLVSTEAVPANTDELAEFRSPPRDLRMIHIAQVVAVALILAGSACIAMGRPLGIYLAAIGTLAWIAVALILWKLRH